MFHVGQQGRALERCLGRTKGLGWRQRRTCGHEHKSVSHYVPLRPTLQACRLALRLLHEQAAAAASAPAAAGAAAAGEEGAPSKPQGPIRVSAREMAAALARINYQSDAAAGHVNAIRNLPQQQQLHLLALATAVATAAAQAVAQAEADAAAREHGLSTDAYRAKYYWGPSSNVKQVTKAANPFAAAKTAGGAAPSPAPSGMRGGAGAPGTPSTPAASMLAGDSAREVALPKAYEHYRQICASMFQQPASEQVSLGPWAAGQGGKLALCFVFTPPRCGTYCLC